MLLNERNLFYIVDACAAVAAAAAAAAVVVAAAAAAIRVSIGRPRWIKINQDYS